MSDAAGPVAPPLPRRLACFLYEGVLLFGVLMVFGYLYATLTQQRNALQGRHGLQAFLFVVLGIYFVAFWSRGGQTVAMKTWHIRLVAARDGGAVSQVRALARYLLAWLWFAPALVALWLADIRGGAGIALVLFAGVAAYAALTRLRADRQYLHDVICGTRLVDARPAPPGRPPDPARHNRAP